MALENREGQRVPQVTFRVRRDNQWVNVTTDDLFKGKTVVAFALPGAFTPTCSSSHLPRYNELAPLFRQHGVDDILCISVNDTFVMNAWAEDQEAENITMVPDGNHVVIVSHDPFPSFNLANEAILPPCTRDEKGPARRGLP